MVANNDMSLRNKSNLKLFLMRSVSAYKPKLSQQPIAVSLFNTSAANTFLFKFLGASEEVNLTFALFDDGVDISSGTGNSTVVTAKEQLRYLREEIFDENFDTDYTLTDLNGIAFSSIDGLITNIDPDIKQGAQQIIPVNITFKRGRIGNV